MTNTHRSGSALVSRMLNAHSKINITMDKLKFFQFSYQEEREFNQTNMKSILDETSFRLLNKHGIKINSQRCWNSIKNKRISYANLYASLINEISVEKKPILGDKESMAWRNIPTILEMFPESKVLMLIRDLRDVVVSFKKNTIAPGNDYLMALFNVIDAIDHFLKYQEKFPKNFYGLRYEEIKASPEQEMKKVCAFLKVDYEPNMVKEDHWKGDRGEPWGNHQVSSFFKEGNYHKPVGRWRNLITPEDWFLCEWLGRKQMQDFGIPLEGKPVSQEVFDRAIKKLMSSELLKDCFKKWCETGEGDQRYPLDPTNPKNWQKDHVVNLDAFELNEKN